ncbi:MAG TPA: OsmC family protein [Bacillota bacterium]|nr:OsmC family protein [Bacillota bacterium]
MAEHRFHLRARWAENKLGEGLIEVGNLQTTVSIPSAMGGLGIGTNPEEMLLGAAATCYMATLESIIERTKIPIHHMSLESVGMVDVIKGMVTYKKIIHQPTVCLHEQATDRHKRLLKRLVYKAERSCMISKALKGNVRIEVQPTIM